MAIRFIGEDHHIGSRDERGDCLQVVTGGDPSSRVVRRIQEDRTGPGVSLEEPRHRPAEAENHPPPARACTALAPGVEVGDISREMRAEQQDAVAGFGGLGEKLLERAWPPDATTMFSADTL